MKAHKSFILLIAVVAIVFFSAKAVFVKMAYAYDIEAVPLLLLRMAFSLPVYFIIAFMKKPSRPKEIHVKDYFWVIGLGFIGYYLASLTDQYVCSWKKFILKLLP